MFVFYFFEWIGVVKFEDNLIGIVLFFDYEFQ